MYAVSTQRKNWTFSDEAELVRLRESANRQFVSKHGHKMDPQYFLTAEEERLYLKFYEVQLLDFCKRFQPPMPKFVIGTAFHYFKRFYLYNSAMDYHPKEILATCVFLSSKVEEFVLSIGQFVANIKGDREKAADIILNDELPLMKALDYNLTVHNPYRPVEGFLVDIKTRCALANPERLRPGVDEFLERALLTDAGLLYAPAQVALAAVLHAASKEQENLDSYVTETLFEGAGRERLGALIEAVRKIRSMVKAVEAPPRDRVKALERKMERCRNQENNPDSEIYKQRQRQALEDEDDAPMISSSTSEAGIRHFTAHNA